MTNEQSFARYGRTLDVHRLVPGSKYTLAGSVTLCRLCHARQPKCATNSDPHAGYLLPARVSKELYDVLRAYAREQRRSVSQVVVMLLEEALAAEGLWPPAAPPGTP
jgi:hypothetical protein